MQYGVFFLVWILHILICIPVEGIQVAQDIRKINIIYALIARTESSVEGQNHYK